MEIYLLGFMIILLSFLLIFYLLKSNNNVTPVVKDTSEKEYLTTRNFKLSKNQIQNIESVHNTFKDVYSKTFDEFVNSFNSDAGNEKEIELWLKMKKTFELIIQEKKYSDLELKKELFQIILFSTLMPLEQVSKNINFQYIDKQELAYTFNIIENNLL